MRSLAPLLISVLIAFSGSCSHQAAKRPVSVVSAQAAPARGPRGGAELVRVARVEGAVTMKRNGAIHALAFDQPVPAGARVCTPGDGAVILVFSNGVILSLTRDSELALEAYVQDPFAGPFDPAAAAEEPSASKTHLRLERGEMLLRAPALRHDRGSSLEVTLPIGTVRVDPENSRSIFRAVFRPNATGQGSVFQLQTALGALRFVGEKPAYPGAFPAGHGVTFDVSVGSDNQQSRVLLPSVLPVPAPLPSAVGAQLAF